MIKIIKTKKYGRGLFATKDIPANTVIEISELIVIPDGKQDRLLLKTDLKHYLYLFGKGSALALGFGSLFNHSDAPNVIWNMNEKKKRITFVTNKAIKKNEQFFINYGYEIK